jgi:phosphoribosyl 1,2-cyclic phosphate phosphodiesterase
MNLQQCARVTEKLRENGNVDENTKVVVTHFSHNGNPIHSRLQKLCKAYGFIPAYDGMEVEI